MLPGDFILDADPFIPTGTAASPERVAELVVDPDIAIAADVIPKLVDGQQPTITQITDAVMASPAYDVDPNDAEAVAAVVAGIIGDVELPA